MPICICSVCIKNSTVTIGGVQQPGRYISNSLRLEHERQDVIRDSAQSSALRSRQLEASSSQGVGPLTTSAANVEHQGIYSAKL